MALIVKWLILMAIYVDKKVTSTYCDLYLAPSTLLGAGRGVFAGNTFDIRQQVEATISINIPSKFIHKSQLINYTFRVPNSNFSSIIFGGGSLYNHLQARNVQHVSNTDQKFDFSVNIMPYTTGETIAFVTVEAISAGQEMFINYGADWFYSRDINQQSIVKTSNHLDCSLSSIIGATCNVSDAGLENYGHCLSDVIIAQSTISLAGKGLFAKKAFHNGDIVSVAPVLTLQRSVVELTVRDSVLMNYCITPPGNHSEVTLFPLNNAALINHASSDKANVRLEWFDWSSIPSNGSYYEHLGGNALDLKARLAQDPEQLFAAQFAPFDVAYVAVRDISPGEELTVDYGDSWVQQWQAYRIEVLAWQRERARSATGSERVGSNGVNGGEVEEVQHDMGLKSVEDAVGFPVFRAFIEPPAGLFSEHWMRE